MTLGSAYVLDYFEALGRLVTNGPIRGVGASQMIVKAHVSARRKALGLPLGSSLLGNHDYASHPPARWLDRCAEAVPTATSLITATTSCYAP